MPGMTPRLWVLSLAPVLAASPAYAQAPGDVAPESYYAQPPAPPPPPPQAAPAAPYGYESAQVRVMAHRWAIGVSIGGMAVAPEDAPEGSEAQFRVGEISLRYRASRRIELQLALSGGRQMLEDDTEGDLATGTVMLALRYRFMPEHRWNWYVMGGIGGSVVAPHQSTSAERDAARRPIGALGVGLERRFQQFALSAEVRAVGLGEREDAMSGGPIVNDGGAAPPKPLPRLPASTAAVYAEQLSGGMLTIGASYYF
jgi:hypothetical protein